AGPGGLRVSPQGSASGALVRRRAVQESQPGMEGAFRTKRERAESRLGLVVRGPKPQGAGSKASHTHRAGCFRPHDALLEETRVSVRRTGSFACHGHRELLRPSRGAGGTDWDYRQRWTANA